MALKMRILLLNPDIITYMGFHVIYRRRKNNKIKGYRTWRITNYKIIHFLTESYTTRIPR